MASDALPTAAATAAAEEMDVDPYEMWIISLLRVLPWFQLTVGLTSFFFLLETYFTIRQIRHIKNNMQVPERLRDCVDAVRFSYLQRWSLARMYFLLVESTLGFGIEMVILWLGVLKIVWNLSFDVMDVLALPHHLSSVRGLLFIFLVSFFSSVIRFLFEMYRILFIDAQPSTKMTVLSGWIIDQLMMLGISLVTGFPAVFLAIMLFQWNFAGHWFVGSFFLSMLGMFFTTIYPDFLAPLFNTFTPLPRGELRTKIEALAQRYRFRIRDISVVDGSKRAAHSNALFVGFGNTKRIILYDTLVQKLDPEQVVAILVHEMGHFKFNHNRNQFLIQLVSLSLFIYTAAKVVNLPHFHRCFGFDTPDTAVGLVIFSYFYSSLANFFHYGLNMLRRRFEFTADAYAVAQGFALEPALIKLHASNLSNLVHDKRFSDYHHSHPSLMERLTHIEAFRAELAKKRS